MSNYTNNPFMEMFKKSMENPMYMWSQDNWAKTVEAVQDSEMYKGFNPGNWMNMSNKMMEKSPWFNKNASNGFNFVENIKNVEMFADMHKLSLESAQAVLRRQAEIIQKHSTDLYKLMQNMVSSPNPETVMSMQAEYVQMAFDSLVSDFKELVEMYSKVNLEAFEAASCKVSDNMQKMRKHSCGNTHHEHDDQQEHHSNSKQESKKTSKK